MQVLQNHFHIGMKKEKKKILIPFSGGLDSVALAYKALKAGHEVKLAYFTIENNTQKIPREKKACDEICKLFRKEFPNNFITWNEGINFGVNEMNSALGFTQLPIWILGILFCSQTDTDEVWVGYCSNDDAISYTKEFKEAFKAFKPFYNCEMPKIKFPLMKSKKWMHARELPDEIFQLTTFCEGITHDEADCGYCQTCNRYKYEELFYKYKRNPQKLTTFGEPQTFSKRVNFPSNQLMLEFDSIESDIELGPEPAECKDEVKMS